jgi:hypothetical protein
MVPPPASSLEPIKLAVPPLQDEQHIASLLMTHIRLRQPWVKGQPDLVFSHFMSLRLLLLRSSARCSANENEMLDIIKNSCGYSKDNRRSDKELAFLLAKDWQFLMATESKKPAAQSREESQVSCQADAPVVNTFSSTGAPAAMPLCLTLIQPKSANHLKTPCPPLDVVSVFRRRQRPPSQF